MKKIIFVALLVVLACPAWAQELFVNGGVTRDAKTGTTALQWSVTYGQDLGKYAAFSFSYINRGINRITIAMALLPRSGGAHPSLIRGYPSLSASGLLLMLIPRLPL